MKNISLFILTFTLLCNTSCCIYGMDDWDGMSSMAGSAFGDMNQDLLQSLHLNPHEIAVVSPFLYLADSHQVDLARKNLTLYNNYPFSMPQDTVEQNTLFFSDADGQRLKNFPQAQLSLLQSKFDQFIIENFPDLSPLSGLCVNNPGSNLNGPKGYGFHFYGKIDQGVSCIQGFFNDWSHEGSFAYFKHLDFAILGLRERLIRQTTIQEISNLLQSRACKEVETLSFRFMHLTREDLEILAGVLRCNCPSLKRLILSFNDLDDQVFSTTGVLKQLIDNITQFPDLSVLDVRGNHLTDPGVWNFSSIQRRREHLAATGNPFPVIRLGFNGITEQMRINTPIPFAELGENTGDFGQPSGFTNEDTTFLKNIFDGVIGTSLEFKKQWLKEQSTYNDLADILLLFRHGGHGGFQTIDMTDRGFSDNSFISYILSHLRHKKILKKVIINKAFNTGIAELDQGLHNARLAQLIGLMTGMESLSLAGNLFGTNSREYRNILHGVQQIKGLDFSGNALNASSNEDIEFLRGLSSSLELGAIVRYINLSHNCLDNSKIGNILSILLRGNCLSFFDVSENFLTLSNEAGVPIPGYINGLVQQLVNSATRNPPLYFIDLSGNTFNPEVEEAIVFGYQQQMAARFPVTHHPAIAWPVLKIDARGGNGERTPMEYISNCKGFVRLARVYCEAGLQNSDNPWRYILTESKELLKLNSRILYQKALENSNKELLDSTVIDLAEALSVNDTLQELNLYGQFGDLGLESIANSLRLNRSLRALTLSGQFGDSGVRNLANALSVNEALQELSLFGQFGDSGLKNLANTLRLNSRLQTLILNGRFRDYGIMHLVNALMSNHTLQALTLKGLFSDMAVRNLLCTLRTNLTLRLDFPGFNADEETKKQSEEFKERVIFH